MRSQQEQWPGSLAAQVQSPGLLRTCCVTGRPSPFSAPQLPHPLKYILPMSPCSPPDTVTAPIIPTAALRRRDQYLHRADGEIKAQGCKASGSTSLSLKDSDTIYLPAWPQPTLPQTHQTCQLRLPRKLTLRMGLLTRQIAVTFLP